MATTTMITTITRGKAEVRSMQFEQALNSLER